MLKYKMQLLEIQGNKKQFLMNILNVKIIKKLNYWQQLFNLQNIKKILI